MPHPDFDAALPAWLRARDVLAGEDAVKGAGTKYLPRLDSQSDEEYAAYVTRASFFGATARTLEEYLDLVFRRAPIISTPNCAGTLNSQPSTLNSFLNDCDGWGTVFLRYARRVLNEVLSVGRGGSLVMWDSDHGRPCVSLWRAEQILNWEVERNGGLSVLKGLALRDRETLRVLRMVGTACVQEVWAQCGEQGTEAEWVLRERVTLRREGNPLGFIPFVFHGPQHSRPEPDRLPLADIIAANLDHYRLDADYKHGLHFAALPTAWVSGFDKGSPLRIGSSAAWVSEVAGASAGFLEFSGAGLGHIEKALEKVERRMALLGARMLESSSEELSTLNSQHSTNSCGLGAIVASVNESLSRVLQLANWWMRGGVVDASVHEGISFSMNTDLAARRLSGEDINAVVGAWKAGGISRQTMLEWLKRGEVLPDGRSVAQEREMIHGGKLTVES